MCLAWVGVGVGMGMGMGMGMIVAASLWVCFVMIFSSGHEPAVDFFFWAWVPLRRALGAKQQIITKNIGKQCEGQIQTQPGNKSWLRANT